MTHEEVQVTKCRERFAFHHDHTELSDDEKAAADLDGTRIPDIIHGVVTHCDGPAGHTDHHVAGFHGGSLLIVWPVFPDAEGNIPFRIQTREGKF